MRNRPPYRRRDPIPGMPIAAPNGVILGYLQGTVLCRYLQPQHQLLTPPAWTIDKVAFDKLRADHEVTKVMIFVRGQVWAIDIEDFDAHSFTLDRHHYLQYAVTLDNWRRS